MKGPKYSFTLIWWNWLNSGTISKSWIFFSEDPNPTLSPVILRAEKIWCKWPQCKNGTCNYVLQFRLWTQHTHTHTHTLLFPQDTNIHPRLTLSDTLALHLHPPTSERRSPKLLLCGLLERGSLWTQPSVSTAWRFCAERTQPFTKPCQSPDRLATESTTTACELRNESDCKIGFQMRGLKKY